MTSKIKDIISRLDLLPHPEGGYYKETYRSEGQIKSDSLPSNMKGSRSYCTGIYFLLTSDNFSSFHRIKQDEMWHFYSGSTLLVHVISPEGEYSQIKLGTNLEEGETPQAVVKANSWFGASLKHSDNYALVGCTVSPGFDFMDFELAKYESLANKFPQHSSIIKLLTRQ